MMITGHKTRDVFERYNIVSDGDLQEAARRVDERIAKQIVTPFDTPTEKTEAVTPLTH
jgi:hypothetical protein